MAQLAPNTQDRTFGASSWKMRFHDEMTGLRAHDSVFRPRPNRLQRFVQLELANTAGMLSANGIGDFSFLTAWFLFSFAQLRFTCSFVSERPALSLRLGLLSGMNEAMNAASQRCHVGGHGQVSPYQPVRMLIGPELSRPPPVPRTVCQSHDGYPIDFEADSGNVFLRLSSLLPRCRRLHTRHRGSCSLHPLPLQDDPSKLPPPS